MTQEHERKPSFQDLVTIKKSETEDAIRKAEVEHMIEELMPKVDRIIVEKVQDDKRLEHVRGFIDDITLFEAMQSFAMKLNQYCFTRWRSVYSLSSDTEKMPYGVIKSGVNVHATDKYEKEKVAQFIEKGFESAEEITSKLVNRRFEFGASFYLTFYGYRLPFSKQFTENEKSRINGPFELMVKIKYPGAGSIPQYSCSMTGEKSQEFSEQQQLIDYLVELYLKEPSGAFKYDEEQWTKLVQQPGFALVMTKLKAVGLDLPIEDFGFVHFTGLKGKIEALAALGGIEIEKLQRLRSIDENTKSIADNTDSLVLLTSIVARKPYLVINLIKSLNLNEYTFKDKISDINNALDKVGELLSSNN